MIHLSHPILRDPGATGRDDAILSGERHFWRESLFQGLKSPWALFLTKRVPEVSKSVPLIGQKNIFLANQRGYLAGQLCLPFTRSGFLHRSNGKIPVRSFRKNRFDEAEEIANHNMETGNTPPSIFSADLSKVS